MKEINAYKCDFCGKLYKRKGDALNHERVCHKNPINDARCIMCSHIELVPVLVKNWLWDGDPYNDTPALIEVKKFHCNKLNKDLYPALILRKKLHLRHPEHYATQELMPNECEYFDLKYYSSDE